MQFRITVESPERAVHTDMVVQCAPSDPVGDIIALVREQTAAVGEPTVDGIAPDPAEQVGRSPLRDGAVLAFSATAQPAPSTDPDLLVQVLSGPDAGLTHPLPTPGTVRVGRDPALELVLSDPDVSAAHCTLRAVGGGVQITDAPSRNGTFVDRVRLTGTEPVEVSVNAEVQVGSTRLRVSRVSAQRAVLVPDGQGGMQFTRAAQEPKSWQPITVESPRRAEPDDDGTSVLSRVGMLAVPLALAGVLALWRGQWIYLLLGLLGPVMVAMSWWNERSRAGRRRRRQDGEYAEALARVRYDLQCAADEEDLHLRRRWPDPRSVVDAATRPTTLLWSRKPADDDWLSLRLGWADRPVTVKRARTGRDDVDLPIIRRAPVGVSLHRHRVLGIATAADATVASVLLQLAVLHGPDELRLVVLAANRPQWGWSRWLPHLAGPGGTAAAWDGDAVDDLLARLAASMHDSSAGTSSTSPPVATVVLVAGLAELGNRTDFLQLLERGPRRGVAFVCVDEDPRLLPRACTAVLRAGGAAALETDGVSTVLTCDELSTADAERAARALAPLRVVGGAAATGVPDAVRYVDLVGPQDVDTIRSQWRLAPEQTNVVVGAGGPLGAKGRGQFSVDIRQHGPHALVAGTAGGGKSEFLQTLLIGLALHNSPERLNFMFVDYMGGPTFEDLRGLPHVVGTVTNLDEGLAQRALRSIQTEMRRRQRLVVELGGVKEIEQYQALVGVPPLPRLLIAIDEFAELKEAQPKMAAELVSAVRIGRKLGVHLILATQRPAGVVDQQIKSNVQLRICLRVLSETDSLDVVEVADAASIPNERKGRAIIKCASDPARTVQVAQVSSSAVRSAGAPARRAVPVRWDEAGALPSAAADRGSATDLQELVAAVTKAAEADGLQATCRPWLAPLPSVIELDTLGTTIHTITVGLQDRLDEADQRTLRVALGDGHVAVVGSAGSGRTAALRAFAVSALLGGRVHLHVIDVGGQLAHLAELPGCGVVVGTDEERVDRLFARLEAEVRRRRAALTARGVGTVAEWWLHDPDTAPAPVLLVIDGVAGLGIGSQPSGPDQRREAVVRLLRDGAAAGLTVCLGTDPVGLRGITTHFAYRAVLRVNNPQDVELPDPTAAVTLPGRVPGRALWLPDGTDVQIPLLDAVPTGAAQDRAVRALRIDAVDDADLLRLDRLPDTVAYAALVSEVPGSSSALLGEGGDVLRPRWTPVPAGRSVVIAGGRRSGRSTAVAAVAASLVATGNRVVLVASNPTDVHRRAAEHGVTVIRPADLAAECAREAPDVVALDDARADSANAFLLDRLDSLALVVAAGEEYENFQDQLLRTALRVACAKILLTPGTLQEATRIREQISRDECFSGPPGRAYLFVDGRRTVAQVPQL